MELSFVALDGAQGVHQEHWPEKEEGGPEARFAFPAQSWRQAVFKQHHGHGKLTRTLQHDVVDAEVLRCMWNHGLQSGGCYQLAGCDALFEELVDAKARAEHTSAEA